MAEENKTGRDERGEHIRKLAEMIREIDFAMLTTAEEDGSLRSRPMSTQRREFDGDLWFFTRASAPKVGEIEREHQVNVSYAAPQDQRYVSVSGRATVVRDRAKIEELWSPELKAWFPGGLDDPDIALLRVAVERAEYWDSPSSAVMHAVGLVKAVATGQTYEPGENEKLDLRKTAGTQG
ncbi:MAG TPA: pyridoxamine 5'-phosphate oxidase family protein [Pyrinomonadaceae bacterium]|jgi:general stress protein 26|nr:pyridoxamine 5'-phosphate oxidase family protein [Pyrinomonadaceae bacterium]